jgi:predicted dinucleotide-binding enzyme
MRGAVRDDEGGEVRAMPTSYRMVVTTSFCDMVDATTSWKDIGMTRISVIGIGNMGSAIATVAARGGADVQLLGRDASRTAEVATAAGAAAATVGDALAGDIVVLAVPYPAVAQLLETYRDQLAGRIVVDITNPVDFGTFDDLVVPADASAAAVIAEQAPPVPGS